jgi:hypothetical protein
MKARVAVKNAENTLMGGWVSFQTKIFSSRFKKAPWGQ